MVSKGLQKIIDDLRDEGIVINGDGYEFPEGFPLQTRLKDVLEEEIDPKYYLSDEIVARFKAKMPSIDSDIKIVGSTKGEGNTRLGQRDECYSSEGIMGCLAATDYKQPKQIAIPESSKRIGGRFDDEKGKHQTGSIWDKEYLAPTIDTCQGGYRQPLVLEEPLLIKEATKKGYAEAYEGDSVNLEQPNSQTRRGRVGTQIANTLMTSCAQGVVEGYRIRKLTPKECWNLMDFDADAFDKASPYISDSALYKQAGNSIVVACMEHIFNNLDIDKIKGGNIWNIESQLTSTKTKENIG